MIKKVIERPFMPQIIPQTLNGVQQAFSSLIKVLIDMFAQNGFAINSLIKNVSSVNVVLFGAVLDGVEDDSAAVIAAAATLTDGDTLLFPFGSCLLESTVTNPGDGITNAHGVLIDGLRDVHVDASACLLKQTATSSKAGHSGGIIAFRNCTDCSFTGKGTGVTNAPAFTTSSAALVAAVGGCDGIMVNGEMTGGRALFMSLSDDVTSTGAKNKNMFVNGIGHVCDRGVVTVFGGSGLYANLILDGCSRDLFMSGSFSVFGINIVSQDCATSGIRLEPNSAAGTVAEIIENGDIVINSVRGLSPINLAPSDTASFPGTIKNVTISGHVDNIGATAAQAVPIFQFKHVDSLMENVDLSGLTVVHDAAGTEAIEIVPDVAGTIRNLKLPKVVGTTNANDHLVRIRNANSATIEYVEVNDIEGLHTAGGYINFFVDDIGGGADFITAIGRNFPSGTTSGQTVAVVAGSQITFDGCRATKAIDIFTAPVGSVTDIYPGKNNINGGGWTDPRAVKTAVVDDATPDVAGVETLLLPANTGALALTQLDGAIAGQTVVLITTSGTNTPTIADSGNFKLSAAWAPNIDDTLTLFALTATSWIEITRSAN